MGIAAPYSVVACVVVVIFIVVAKDFLRRSPGREGWPEWTR